MSLKPPPKVVRFDALTADTFRVNGTLINIMGVPEFDSGSVVNCRKECPSACVKQVDTITPVVPTAPCACPWVFELRIVRRSTGFQRVQGTFDKTFFFEYTNPNGDAPTAALISTSIVNQINSDPYSAVVAVDLTGSFTITEKDCDTMDGTRGFKTYSNSATIVNTTAHTRPVLPVHEVQQNFPVLPGDAFGLANTANCGTYCRYQLEIRPISVTRGPHLANEFTERGLELDIWVNSSLANFAADWDNEWLASFNC